MASLLIIVSATFASCLAIAATVCILASLQEHKQAKNISRFKTEPNGIRWAIIGGEFIEERING